MFLDPDDYDEIEPDEGETFYSYSQQFDDRYDGYRADIGERFSIEGTKLA